MREEFITARTPSPKTGLWRTEGNCSTATASGWGVSGSGKSFSAKEEIVSIALSTEDDILILDPESEFTFLTESIRRRSDPYFRHV